jgi:hypothetical protein
MVCRGYLTINAMCWKNRESLISCEDYLTIKFHSTDTNESSAPVTHEHYIFDNVMIMEK